jgi:CheY-like chemotaxis protein
MPTNNQEILEALKFEMDFIEKGGYGRSVRTPWKPTSVFLDSPTCPNFDDPSRPHPCDDCFLMGFVPPEHRSHLIPCHCIPLNEAGDTVHSLGRRENQQELEEAVKAWLRAAIKRFEEKLAGSAKKGLKRILIVDDDEHVLMALEALLAGEGYDTTTAWSGHEALELLGSKQFDLALIDDWLPDLNSNEILKQIKRMEVQPLVIVMQARSTHSEVGQLASSVVSDVVGKWRPRREISQAVHKCLTSTQHTKVST